MQCDMQLRCYVTRLLEFHGISQPSVEEVGIWGDHTTRSKPSLFTTRPCYKGVVGRLISIDPWGNGTCILIAKGTNVQYPELVSGLQPKTVAVDCPRLFQTVGLKMASRLLQFDGKPSTLQKEKTWLRMDTGQTQYSSPSLSE